MNPVTFYSLSFPKRTCKKERTRCNMSLLHVIKYGFVWKWRQSLLGLVYYLDCIITLNLTSTLPVDSVRKPYLLRYGSCVYEKKTKSCIHYGNYLKENQFYGRKYSFLRMMNPEGYMYNYWCLYLFIIDCWMSKKKRYSMFKVG